MSYSESADPEEQPAQTGRQKLRAASPQTRRGNDENALISGQPVLLQPLAALQPRHFAFMRAVIQGMNLRQSWDRYLVAEAVVAGAHSPQDLIAWIEDLYAAAVQFHRSSGPRRLVVFRRQAAAAAKTAPSLSEFVVSRDLENFSEAEQLDAYRSHHRDQHCTPAVATRHARQVARQLAALYWLEQLSVKQSRSSSRDIHPLTTAQSDPTFAQPWFAGSFAPGNSVALDDLANWIAPALANRLAAAGLRRYGDLQQRFTRHGERWWYGIAGIGPIKAARIMRRLAVDPQAAGKPCLDPVSSVAAAITATDAPDVPLVAVKSRPDQAREAVRFDLRPALEPAIDPARIRPLQELAKAEPQAAEVGGGIDRPGCRIAAKTDLEALRCWLDAKRTVAAHGLFPMPHCLERAVPGWAELTIRTHTQRAYWKEAERFQLWLYLTRGSSLSFANANACQAYLEFLCAPTPAWCGRRAQRRQEATWRPYAGALSPNAQRFSCAVLRALYGYLVAVGYLADNPWNTIPRIDPAAILGLSRHAPLVSPTTSMRATSGVNPRADAGQSACPPVNCTDHRLRVAKLLQRDSGLSPAALVRLTWVDLIVPRRSGNEWHLRLPRSPARAIAAAGQGPTAAARPAQPVARATIPIAGDTRRALKAYFVVRGLAWPPAPAAHPAPRQVFLIGRASDAALRAPWAPCAREAVDMAAGIAAGTLRDQMRHAARHRKATP